jgi:hypothetical protein
MEQDMEDSEHSELRNRSCPSILGVKEITLKSKPEKKEELSTEGKKVVKCKGAEVLGMSKEQRSQHGRNDSL